MTDIANVAIGVDTRGLKDGQTELKALARTGAEAEQSVNKSADKMSEGMTSVSKSIAFAATALVALGGSMAVREIVDYTNRWTDLNSKLVNATGSQEAADAAMKGLSQTARTTYSSLEATAESFLRNNMTLTELGYTTAQQINLSDALNNSLVISGTKGQAAESVMVALSKAMATGTLRGENFNTVIASGGRMVEALADGLGVTTLELRSMAEAGELDTGRVVEALTSQMEKLREEAEAMPATIGDAFGLLGNAFFEMVGRMDTVNGTSTTFAEKIVQIADGMGVFNQALAEMDVEISKLTDSTEIQEWGGEVAETFAFLADWATSTIGVIGIVSNGLSANLAMSKALLKGDMEAFDAAANRLATNVDDWVVRSDRYAKALENIRNKQNQTTESTDDVAEATAGATGSVVELLATERAAIQYYKDLADSSSKLNKEIVAQDRETQKLNEKIESQIEKLRRQTVASEMTSRAAAIYNAVMDLGTTATDRQIVAAATYAAKLYDQEAALDAAAAAAKNKAREDAELERASVRAAEESQRAWERFEDSFADTAVDLYVHGSNAFESIFKSFEAMIIRMVAKKALLKAADFFGIDTGSVFGGGGGGSTGSGIAGSIGKTAVSEIAKKTLTSIFGSSAAAGSGSAVATALGSGGVGGVAGTVAGGASAATGGAGVWSAITGGASAAGGAVLKALAAIPGWGWALAGAGVLASVLDDSGTYSHNAGFLLHDLPGVDADRKFDVEQFDSGLAPVGFNRRTSVEEASAVVDTFRAYDSRLTEIAKAAGLAVNYTNTNFGGYDEKGRGQGVFFGSATEDGGKDGIPLDQQINQFVSQWIQGLSGQVDQAKIAEVLAAGSADAMIDQIAAIMQEMNPQAAQGAQENTQALATLTTELQSSNLASAQNSSDMRTIVESMERAVGMFAMAVNEMSRIAYDREVNA